MSLKKPQAPHTFNDLCPHAKHIMGAWIFEENTTDAENIVGILDDIECPAKLDDIFSSFVHSDYVNANSGTIFIRGSGQHLGVHNVTIAWDTSTEIFTDTQSTAHYDQSFVFGHHPFITGIDITSLHMLAVYSNKFSQQDVDLLNMYPYVIIDKVLKIRSSDTSMQFTINSHLPGIEATEWKFSPQSSKKFTIVTRPGGVGTTKSANILSSDTNRLDIWLPPFETHIVQARQLKENNQFTAWTSKHAAPIHREHRTSYDRFQALSRAGTTIF